MALVRSLVRLLLWSVLLCVVLLIVSILEPPGWRAPHLDDFRFQISGAIGLIGLSLLMIAAWAKSQAPDRKTWIGTHAGIVAGGIAAVAWAPQWSGYIIATALGLFAFAPITLGRLAQRRQTAGDDRSAAFYARLARFLHPSRQWRFDSSFLTARTLGSIEERVAAYRALAAHATREHSEFLNCWISAEQNDWESVLRQLRSAGDKPSALKSYEIRALGELGRVDEMIATYASAESVLPSNGLPVCRLFVLAFSGRIEAVRCVLKGPLRSFSPRDQAFWIFIASQAAGTDDEEARRDLLSHARAADDETFCRKVHGYLNAAAMPGGVVLSAESRATIAAIEATLRETKG